MNDRTAENVEILLLPLGDRLRVPAGTELQDVLFEKGVEFPCGGRGRCQGCKIKVLSGSLSVSSDDAQKLTSAEIGEGWRLACRARAESNLTLELAQWEAAILADDSRFEFIPQEGHGIAIDVGTTTIVAQRLDLATGHVLGVRTALNDQARYGADIMSRIEFAMAGEGQCVLQALIREQIGAIVRDLASSAGAAQLRRIVLAGNTVMHHLFSGISVEPLSHYPFEPQNCDAQHFDSASLGWNLPDNPEVVFLPCLGGFVGSDILAGILATRMHDSDSLVALMDLGTNGEIVVGNRHRLLCASTAAGPAFEGARISMGMRAATGAISEVHVQGDSLVCHVLGGGPARGLCGSGLVDAIAAGLDLGWIKPSGRLVNGSELILTPPVILNQWDIRELQLAKGAIAAGLRILLQEWGAKVEDLSCVYLAGAFGNYIRHPSARRIGLLDFPLEKVQPVGNTALLGSKLLLFQPGNDFRCGELVNRTRHVCLHEHERFQDTYVEEMGFPLT